MSFKFLGAVQHNVVAVDGCIIAQLIQGKSKVAIEQFNLPSNENEIATPLLHCSRPITVHQPLIMGVFQNECNLRLSSAINAVNGAANYLNVSHFVEKYLAIILRHSQNILRVFFLLESVRSLILLGLICFSKMWVMCLFCCNSMPARLKQI